MCVAAPSALAQDAMGARSSANTAQLGTVRRASAARSSEAANGAPSSTWSRSRSRSTYEWLTTTTRGDVPSSPAAVSRKSSSSSRRSRARFSAAVSRGSHQCCVCLSRLRSSVSSPRRSAVAAASAPVPRSSAARLRSTSSVGVPAESRPKPRRPPLSRASGSTTSALPRAPAAHSATAAVWSARQSGEEVMIAPGEPSAIGSASSTPASVPAWSTPTTVSPWSVSRSMAATLSRRHAAFQRDSAWRTR
mmetsp:Transcript_20625/g.52352  ORF Transcript_20625/g.52352 Transcript_20625/m.52352 type:complete len:249 (-) Transcript_20625:119-865(-)